MLEIAVQRSVVVVELVERFLCCPGSYCRQWAPVMAGVYWIRIAAPGGSMPESSFRSVLCGVLTTNEWLDCMVDLSHTTVCFGEM